MATVEDTLREQLREVLDAAEYPVENQMDLLPALPDGPSTTFEAGDVRVTAVELATKLGKYQSFPYDSAEALVNDVIDGMQQEDML